MEKIRFGRTGLEVSRIAFGGIPIMRLSKADAVKLVGQIIDTGVNFIDTANAYLDSEEKIGEALAGRKRGDFVLASKSLANDKKTFSEHIDLSLKRLKTDYIDIFQIHNIGTPAKREAVFAEGGAMEALSEAVKAGKVHFPGFSSHNVDIAMEIMKGGDFAVVQLPFNFLDDQSEKAVPLAKELDIGFIAMKPLGGGMLESAELAFRYLLQFDNVVPDPGIEKIEEIIEIADIVKRRPPLTGEDKKAIEKLRVELGPVWCRRCEYCQPCPQGIPINAVLVVKSFHKRFTPDRLKSMAGGAVEKAASCNECGQCVKRCPYSLEIPRLVKENAAFYNSLGL
ncbi:MAG: aldo/keto reductase [Spirochaetes bacterium]|nr:aldo/keto reductase [Spirochaetota bacterium]